MSKSPPFLSAPVAMFALAFCLFGCGGGGGGGGSGGGQGTDASLASLALSAGTLMPAFDAGTTSYTVFVRNTVPSITVGSTAADGGATVTVNGNAASTPVPITVPVTQIDVVVTTASGATTTYALTVLRFVSFDLVDPTPGANDRFGSDVISLPNGNIAVTDPLDTSVVVQNGAVHLYNPVLASLPVGSIHGDVPGDLIGSGGLTALANSNFVVVSPIDDEAGVINAGSVRLIDGLLGTQIGPTLVGDVSDDLDRTEITALANGNFVVASPRDDVPGAVDGGSVRLINGATGAQIGVALVGDVANDRMGIDGVTPLGNSNFIVASGQDNVGGAVDVGSVRLFNGTTGAEIGSGLVGGETLDFDDLEVYALPNGNFVVLSELDNEGGVVEVGAVRLFSGTTGAQIGVPLVGDVAGDQLGYHGLLVLANGNFVVASGLDDEGGIEDAGSVRLVSGTTGAQIGPALVGDAIDDCVGLGPNAALGNGNFVIASRRDNAGAVINAGSVRLISGTTGAQIGPTLVGDSTDDFLGSRGVTALGNNNFVVSSHQDDVAGVSDAGSVRLVDGTTGLQIGAALSGNNTGDQLGRDGVTALGNGNFVIASPDDNQGGFPDGGSVRLASGTTGAQIGPALVGDSLSARLGDDPVTVFGNGDYIVNSERDGEGGIVNAGSVRLMNGTTAALIGTKLTGSARDDQMSTRVVAPTHGAFFIVAFPRWDNGSLDSGRVRVIAE